MSNRLGNIGIIAAILALLMLNGIVNATWGVPSGVLNYYNITITNNQNAPMAANTAVPITINSIALNAYVANNLVNVEVFNGFTKGVVDSWIQNQTSNSVQGNGNTIVWIKFPVPIPASSSSVNTISVGFASLTTSVLNKANTGIAPQDWCTTGGTVCPQTYYGEYDDGNAVFANIGTNTFYTNFTGTSLGFLISNTFGIGTGQAATVNNGLTLTQATGSGTYTGVSVAFPYYTTNVVISSIWSGLPTSSSGGTGYSWAEGQYNSLIGGTSNAPIASSGGSGVSSCPNAAIPAFNAIALSQGGGGLSWCLESAGVTQSWLNNGATGEPQCIGSQCVTATSIITANMSIAGTKGEHNYTTVNSMTAFSAGFPGIAVWNSGTGTAHNTGTVQWWFATQAPPSGIYPAQSNGIVYTSPSSGLTASISSPSNTFVDVGQYETFTASESSGVSPFTYNILVVNSGSTSTIAHNDLIIGTSATSEVFTFQTITGDTSNSPEEANVIITDSSPTTVASTYSSQFTISPALVAGTITPSSPNIDSGQSITLTANPSGGTVGGGYIYSWYTGASCTSQIGGASSSTYTATPASTTTYYYLVTDHASTAVSQCSAGDTVTVSTTTLQVPSIAPSSPGSQNAGTTYTWSAYDTGGTTPYTYNFFVYNSASNIQVASQSSSSNMMAYFIPAGENGNTLYANVFVVDNAYSPVSMNSIHSGILTVSGSVALYTPIYLQNANSIITLAALSTQNCINNFQGGSCNGNVVYTSNIVLNQDLFVNGNVQINSGETLWTNGYSVITNGNLVIIGTISTNVISNGAPLQTSGGNITTSYGASGGGGYNGLVGGNTRLSGGTAGMGGANVITTPVLSNANILTIFGGDYYLLGGAGGGASGGGAYGGTGGNGAYGVYLQANVISGSGTVNAMGAAGASANILFSYSPGGGGGGIIIEAYKSADEGITNVYAGGAGNGGQGNLKGGAGGNGNVIKYQWTIPPISVNTIVETYPVNFFTLSPSPTILYSLAQTYGGSTTVLQNNQLNISYTPPSIQLPGFYNYNFTESGNSGFVNVYLNVSMDMADISSPLTCNSPIIQYFPNFCSTPSFTQIPLSWYIKSDNPLNQYSNTITGDQWSNANVSFMPSISLTYNSFAPFVVNDINNPNIGSLTQSQFLFLSGNTVPTIPYTREVFNSSGFDLQFYTSLPTSRSDSLQALFNNYSFLASYTFSTNTFPMNNIKTYIPLSNYQNPSITIQNYTTAASATGYAGQTINNYCTFSLSNGNFANSFSYLPNGNASTYSATITLSNGNIANGYYLVVQTILPAYQVLSALITSASSFGIVLQPHTTYRFLVYSPSCKLVYTSAYSQPSNPITISLPANVTVPLTSPNQFLKNISFSCATTPVGAYNTLLTCQWKSLNNTKYVTTLNVTLNEGVYSNQTCYVNAYGTANTLTCLAPYTNKYQYQYVFNLIDAPGALAQGLFGYYSDTYGANGVWFWILMVATLILLGVTRSPTLTILFFEAGVTAGGLLGFVPYTGFILGASYIAAALILYMINRGNV